MKPLVQHVYRPEDVTFLLTDLTGQVEEISVEEKERRIDQGISYSEMISKEEAPLPQTKELFEQLVQTKRQAIADYIRIVSEAIYQAKQGEVVLVSLARAGTPFGILIKRYLEQKYQIKVPHYSVSIIRGKGIDTQALTFILSQHSDRSIQFVDGWTGKGSIIDELERSILQFNHVHQTEISADLAVVADPARRCRLYGTHLDVNLPNSCLNATVSGLISRTICSSDLLEGKDFHGAIYLSRLEEHDQSQWFVHQIESVFIFEDLTPTEQLSIANRQVHQKYATMVARQIQATYQVKDFHKVKLSIGESARVLLRRHPRLLLIKDETLEDVQPLLQLAQAKNVPIQRLKEDEGGHYQAIAIIEEVESNG